MSRYLACFFLLGLSACSSISTVPSNKAAQSSPADIAAWSLDGRIGVQGGADGKAWQANLHWEHDPIQDRLRLSGPLNQGLVSIVSQGKLLYVNEGDGVSEMSRDAGSMLRKRLGFAVPIDSLRYWILGVPDPGSPSIAIKAAVGDSPAGFQQLGWQVTPLHAGNFGGWLLPQKLIVKGSAVKLKILADQWEIIK